MLRKKRTRFNSSRGNDEKDEELSEISDISGPELPEAQPSKTKNKINKRTRSMFTYLEDKEMLNYIMTENRYNEIKGIALWKDMEILKITNHTKQSMKDRFVKKVIPNLHQYNVNPSWFKRLQRLFPEILKKNPDKENTKTESPLDANPNENKRHSSRFNFSPKNSKNTRKSKIEEESSNGDSEENRTHASVEDINVVPNSAPTPKTSTASETIEDSPAHKDNSPSEQSDELSDYDQYLIGIAEKEKKPSRKLSTSSSTSSPPPHTTKERSFDLLNQTDQSMEVSSEKELNESNEESALPDRRARLQRRRQMRKSKQSSDDYEESSEKTSPLTSRHNNKRKRKITDYLTNSESEKNSLENEDEQPNSEEENTERPKPTSHHKKRRKTNAANCSVNSTSENISNENEDVQPNGVASPEEPTPSSSTSPVKEMRKRPLTISLTKEMSSEDKDADVQDKSEDQDETQKLNNYESIISNISKSTGLTKREVFYTIYCFNGNIDKAVTYIRLGPELSNLNPWSSEEDKIISSTDEASMKKVLKQRGNKHIAERLEFLELYSDSLT